MAQNLQYFRIPKEGATLTEMAMKYRDLRLEGLRLSPEAFSSTLEVESQYSLKVWEQRLANPETETFICGVPMSEEMELQRVSDATSSNLQWIAQVTIRGPLDETNTYVGDAKKQAREDQSTQEELWQILALYALPVYRGQGIAQNLCKEALRFLELDRLHAPESSLKRVTARTMIRAKNLGSISLFRKIGFEDAGLCTLAEALSANGEKIPNNLGSEVLHVRGGVVLKYTIDKS